MDKKLLPPLLAVICVFSSAGCRKGNAVNSFIAEMDAFTNELVKRVESAPNPSAGVDEAQKYMDSRKADLKAKFDALKSVRDAQVDEEAKKLMVESLTRNAMSVASLQMKYLGTSVKDPAFRTKLGKLTEDYQRLFTP